MSKKESEKVQNIIQETVQHFCSDYFYNEGGWEIRTTEEEAEIVLSNLYELVECGYTDKFGIESFTLKLREGGNLFSDIPIHYIIEDRDALLNYVDMDKLYQSPDGWRYEPA